MTSSLPSLFLVGVFVFSKPIQYILRVHFTRACLFTRGILQGEGWNCAPWVWALQRGWGVRNVGLNQYILLFVFGRGQGKILQENLDGD